MIRKAPVALAAIFVSLLFVLGTAQAASADTVQTPPADEEIVDQVQDGPECTGPEIVSEPNNPPADTIEDQVDTNVPLEEPVIEDVEEPIEEPPTDDTDVPPTDEDPAPIAEPPAPEAPLPTVEEYVAAPIADNAAQLPEVETTTSEEVNHPAIPISEAHESQPQRSPNWTLEGALALAALLTILSLLASKLRNPNRGENA